MNERPDVWSPRPSKIPRAWLSRRSSGESVVIWIESRVIFRLALVIVCNLIPLVGFVEFDWTANTVVILGMFNLAMVFASSTAVECALPRLLSANAQQERVHAIVWAFITVCTAWIRVLIPGHLVSIA